MRAKKIKKGFVLFNAALRRARRPNRRSNRRERDRDRMMHHAVEWANGHLGHLGSRCTEPWIIVASFFLSFVCHDPARWWLAILRGWSFIKDVRLYNSWFKKRNKTKQVRCMASVHPTLHGIPSEIFHLGIENEREKRKKRVNCSLLDITYYLIPTTH